MRDVAPLIVGDDFFSLGQFEVADRLQPLLKDIEDQQLMHALFVKTAHHVGSIDYFYDQPHDFDNGEKPHADNTAGLHAALAAADRNNNL